MWKSLKGPGSTSSNTLGLGGILEEASAASSLQGGGSPSRSTTPTPKVVTPQMEAPESREGGLNAIFSPDNGARGVLHRATTPEPVPRTDRHNSEPESGGRSFTRMHSVDSQMNVLAAGGSLEKSRYNSYGDIAEASCVASGAITTRLNALTASPSAGRRFLVAPLPSNASPHPLTPPDSQEDITEETDQEGLHIYLNHGKGHLKPRETTPPCDTRVRSSSSSGAQAKGTITDLSSALAKKNEEIKEITIDRDSAKALNRELQKTVTSQKAQMEQQRLTITRLEQKIAALQTTVGEHEETINQGLRSVDCLTQENELLRTAIQQQSDELIIAKREREDAKKHAAECEALTQAAKSELENEKRYAEWERSKRAETQKFLEERVEVMSRELREERRAREEEKTIADEEIGGLRNALRKERERIRDMEARLEQQKAQAQTLERQLASVKQIMEPAPWQLSNQCNHPSCGQPFTFMARRHHCRQCGLSMCSAHSEHTARVWRQAQERVCDGCYAKGMVQL
eukprot:comp11490_c0_seq1/m.5939 comp11490_c0_seq1/g.5939  ORF comp11490_c0_seq1/g.5939 comp11490_c0_seq1/m.5939 type:complete len:516 (-) comp11490_c0_seq1:119-1666(-)